MRFFDSLPAAGNRARLGCRVLAMLCLGVWAFSTRAQAALPPTITQQPQKYTVVEGASHTFSVAATGEVPLNYQWRFNGSNLPGQINPTLPLSSIHLSDAGGYQVVVANAGGAVTSLVALLTVRSSNAPVYAAPDRGWAYIFTGNNTSSSGTAALDGTWNHDNGSDSWSGLARGLGNGPAGGIGANDGALTLEDAITAGSSTTDDRRYYLTHNLLQDASVTNASTILNDGVTLSFRARLTPPTDPLIELAGAPDGWVNLNDGKGMFGIRQGGGGGMIISFSLNQGIEDTGTSTTFDFGQAGLHMNTLNGNTRSPLVDPGEGGALNLLPLAPAVFHEFWIIIQDNGANPGTHKVSIYLDGSQTPTVFNVTAGTGTDVASTDVTSTNYLALGLPGTVQHGAVDVDFLAYKPGVIAPAGFNDPLAFVLLPSNQAAIAGETASFNVTVTGTPPYQYQWYKNGVALSGATNANYATPPMTPADNNAQFIVIVTNPCGSITSAPPASLQLLAAPVIAAPPQDLVVTNGDSAVFSVTATSATAPTYQWRFHGNDITGATNAAYSIASASPVHAGGYDVVVRNNAASVTSVVATLTVRTLDYGDAPAPYPTLRTSNGARHLIVAGLRLGAMVDFELEGQPGAAATGDDTSSSDDEDGVNFITPLRVGQLTLVEVVVSAGGFLDAWIDFNRDGSWAEAADQVFTSRTLVAGTNLLSFPVPATAATGGSFARFRFSTAGGLSFLGPAADGEVEDHAVTITPAADLSVSGFSAPNPVGVGSNLTYTLLVSNAGPSTAEGITLSNTLPATVNFVSATASQGHCTPSGSRVHCELGSLNPTATLAVTLVVVPNVSGSISLAAEVAGSTADLVAVNNSATVLTAVENPPVVTTPPQSQTVVQGHSATFTVAASGAGPLNYQWRFNGSDLSGETNISLTLANVQSAHEGSYTVRVMNRVGSTFSAPALLAVLLPPVITQPPLSRTNPVGSTATFTVVATGSAPLSYQWYFNGATAVPGGTNATLLLASVQSAHSGNYHVLISNTAGLTPSAAAALSVFEMDFGDAPDPSYPTLLAHNGARHRLVPGFGLGAGIDSEPEGLASAAATGDDLDHGDDEDGVTFASSLLAGQTINVSVVASANGFLNAWVDFNRNGSWADAGEHVFSNVALLAGMNALSLVVPANVASGLGFARFRFNSAGGLSFEGEAADGEVEDYAVPMGGAVDLAITSWEAPAVIPTGSNLIYTITITNRGPSLATEVTLSNTLPSSFTFSQATASQGSCTYNGSAVICTLGSLSAQSAAKVTFAVVPTLAGIVLNSATVQAADTEVQPTDNTAQAVTAVQNIPVILAQPQSRRSYVGQTATLTVTATGTDLRYQWYRNGSNALLGGTNATLALADVQKSQAGQYHVRITNAVGAVTSSMVMLGVVEADFGDAPDPYPTLQIFNGARHEIVPGIHLGARVDFEGDGQPHPAALGDDLNGEDDDDGVTFTSPLLVGQTVSLNVVASTPGFLDGWLDFDSNGSWADFGEQIFVSQPLVAGMNALTFPVPLGAPPTNTFARFRFSTAGGLTPEGAALDGEVEDYRVSIQATIDLEVQKKDLPDPVSVGAPLIYSLLVTNHGPALAPGIALHDALPPGVSFVSSASSQGSCTYAGQVVECALGSLAPGQSATVSIQVVAQSPGFLTNVVSVVAQGFDLDFTNNIARQTTAVVVVSPAFTNPNLIGVQASGAATPYPSTIFVSGLTAAVYKATVSLRGLAHEFADDLDILLVSPSGKAALLVSDAGGSVPIDLVTIVLDDDAELRLPDSGNISSTTYRPANYDGSDPDFFDAPAPAGPYATNLVAFRGTDPNGTWSLFVMDDSASDIGSIADGWSLSFATMNALTGLSVTQVDSPDPVAVGTPLTYYLSLTNRGPASATGVLLADVLPAGALFLSASSSQGSCTNDSGIVRCYLGNLAAGAHAAVTVAVLPSSVGLHTNRVTVSANEPNANGANNSALVVTDVTLPIDVGVSQTGSSTPALVGEPFTYTLVVTNYATNTATGVTLRDTLLGGVSFSSPVASQGSCAVDNGIIHCELGNLPGHSSATVTIAVAPQQLILMTNTAILSVHEWDANLGDNAHTLFTPVLARAGPFANPSAITLIDSGSATLYPSTLLVSGATGVVHRVTVTLSNLIHFLPDDLDLLLVGPKGQATLLMSDAGGASLVIGATLTFDDDALSVLPDEAPITSGTFKPTAYDAGSDSFPPPAPAGPFTSALAVFNGTDPNGTWSLYAFDDQAPNSGGIGGWSLSLFTANPNTDLAIAATGSPNPVVTGSNLTYTLTITNRGPVRATGVALADILPGNLLSVASTQGQWTNDNGTVRCALGALEVGGQALVTIVAQSTQMGLITNVATVSADLLDLQPANNLAKTITAVEDPPFLTQPPLPQTVTNNGSVTFSVVASGSGPLFYQWQRAGADIPNATNASFGFAVATPADRGVYSVRVTNRVGAVQSGPVPLTVLVVPTITGIPPAQIIEEDTTTGELSFMVGDDETAAGNLAISATSSNLSLVPTANIVFGGSGGNRTVTVTPAGNQFGSAMIVLRVTDADGLSASGLLAVTVTPRNDVPTITSIANQSIDEDMPLTLFFTVGDAETAAGSLILSRSSSNLDLVTTAAIVLGGSGNSRTAMVTPAPNRSGTTTIILTVADNDGANASTSFELTVNPVNDPPALFPIADQTIEPNTATSLIPVIVGDLESPAETLTLSASSSKPSLVPEANIVFGGSGSNRTVRITPVADQRGTAQITLTVNDGSPANNTTNRSFFLVVQPPDTLPTLSEVVDQFTVEDIARTIALTVGGPATLAGNPMLAGHSLNAALVPDANITFGGSGSNRTVTLRPATNQSGSAMIILTLTDTNGDTATRSFLLTVIAANDPPTLSHIAPQTVNEGGATAALAFSVGDVETAADSLIVTASSSNPVLLPPANLVLGGSGSDRTIMLTPAADVSGSATITLQVRDGDGLATTDTFLLTIAGVNDPPSLSALPDVTMNANTSLSLPIAVSDLESPTTSLTLSNSSSNAGLIPSSRIIFGGDGPNRMVTLTPLSDQVGLATITITVADSNGDTASDSFVLTVNAAQDAPIITSQPQSQAASRGANVLFTVEAAGAPPLRYQWQFNGNDLTDATDANLNLGNVQPSNAGSYTVTVSNPFGTANSAPATLTVLAAPQSPTIAPIAPQATSEDTPITVPFTVSDPDTPPFHLAVTASSTNVALVPNASIALNGVGNNRTATITPATNASGTTLITLTVNDGNSTSNRSFVLTVNPVNDPPTLDPLPDLAFVSRPAQQTINLTGIGSGAPGETASLTVTVSSSNTGLVPTPTVNYNNPNPTGSISFRPSNGAGLSVITVTVNDGGAANNITSRSFTIYQRASANALPTISSIAGQVTSEDTPTPDLPFTVSDAATPAAQLVVKGNSSNTNLVPNSAILFGGNGGSRTVTVRPATNQSGSATITLAVTNGAFGYANTSFLLTVNPVNDPPSISNIPDQTADEDTTVGPLEFTVGDVETPARSLSLTATSTDQTLVPNSSILLGGSGTNRALLITPVTNRFGVTTITVAVSDGNRTNSDSFLLTIGTLNDPPNISDIADQAVAGNTSTAPIPFTIGDLETPAESLSVTGSCSNPALVPNSGLAFRGSGSNRTVQITPAPGQSGAALITITVMDGNGGSVSDAFGLTVTLANETPTLDPIGDMTLPESAGAQTVNLTGIRSGTVDENQVLTVTASSSNPGLISHPHVTYASPDSTASLTFTPTPTSNGTATITVTVNDGQSANNLFSRHFIVTLAAAPKISAVADQFTAANRPAVVPFGVSDIETPAANLTVTASSSNAGLVPSSGVALGGSGANRRLTLTPMANESGYTLITLTVTDGDGLSSSTHFALIVLPGNIIPPGVPVLQIVFVNDSPRLYFSTVSGKNYTVQYKNSLDAALWQDLAPVAGTGNLVFVDDPTAVGPQRFYRVRAD